MKTRLFAPILIVLTGTLLQAQVVTPYFTRSSFNGAAGATTTIDFTGAQGNYPAGFTLNGVTFAGINPSFQGQTQTSVFEVIDGLNLGSGGNNVLYALNDNTASVYTTLITLPAGGVLSFGTDIKLNDPSGTGTFTVQLFSYGQPLGMPFNTLAFTPLTFNQFGFIGFTSDTPITSVEIGKFTGMSGSPSVVLDNVSFGAAVPEPATWVLVSLGIAGVAVFRRYIRREA